MSRSRRGVHVVVTWTIVTSTMLIVVERVAHIISSTHVSIAVIVMDSSGRWLLAHVVPASPAVQSLVFIQLAFTLWIVSWDI